MSVCLSSQKSHSVVEEPRRGPGNVYKPHTRDFAAAGCRDAGTPDTCTIAMQTHTNKTPRTPKAVVYKRTEHDNFRAQSGRVLVSGRHTAGRTDEWTSRQIGPTQHVNRHDDRPRGPNNGMLPTNFMSWYARTSCARYIIEYGPRPPMHQHDCGYVCWSFCGASWHGHRRRDHFRAQYGSCLCLSKYTVRVKKTEN